MRPKDDPDQERKAARVQKEQKLARLEKMLLHGVHNHYQLSAAFNVSIVTINKWISKIHKRWWKYEREDMDEERRFRIKQVEYIGYLALNAFERSQKDSEDFTINSRPCEACVQGQIEGNPDQWSECPDCLGKGEIRVETVRIKGQSGDATFLRLAKDCVMECAKMNNVLPQTVKVGMLRSQTQEIGGKILNQTEELYAELPVDLIIKSKAVLEEVKNQLKGDAKTTIETKVIEEKENGDGDN